MGVVSGRTYNEDQNLLVLILEPTTFGEPLYGSYRGILEFLIRGFGSGFFRV